MSFKYLMLFAAMIIGSFADNVTVETASPEIANTTTDIPDVIVLCGPEGDGYCLHGVCIHARDIDGMYCRCDHGYTGVRCQHIV
uniref:Viral growth factor n=1 Tax=Ectromelia virus TaxID=12643 RepID=Q7TDW4_9POXV|nr:viral growth factor [Ectromelia virus]CAG7619517.1 viral growth factor [Ectromelia virus]